MTIHLDVDVDGLRYAASRLRDAADTLDDPTPAPAPTTSHAGGGPPSGREALRESTTWIERAALALEALRQEGAILADRAERVATMWEHAEQTLSGG